MNIENFIYKACHGGPISAVAIEGDRLYSAAYDGCLGVWRVINGKPVADRFLYLHTKGVNCIAIAPNGLVVATGGSDGGVCIVRFAGGAAQVTRCSHAGDVESVAFTADSRFLMTGGTDGFARLFCAETGRAILSVDHGKTVGAIVRHPDSGHVITACNDAVIRLIRVSDGETIASIASHTGPVKTLGVVRDGILSAGHDQRLLLHDFQLQNPKVIATFTTTAKTIAIEPSGEYFWIGVYDQHTARWKVGNAGENYVEDRTIYSARSWAHGLAAGEGIAAIGSFDGVPLLVSNASLDLHLEAAHIQVPCISTSVATASEQMLIAGDSGLIRHFNLHDQHQEPIISLNGAITSLTGSLNDLIVATWTGEIFRYKCCIQTWKAQWSGTGSRDPERAASPVLRVARANGRVLAGLYTSGWACFRELDGELLWTNREATGAVKAVALHGDVYAVTGRYDSLRVGCAATGIVKARLQLATPVSDVVSLSPYAPSGQPRVAVCAGANEVWIADVMVNGDQWELSLIHKGFGHQLPIKALLWLDSETICSGDYAGRIVRHRVGEQSALIRSVECRTGVSSLNVLSDGRLVWTTFDGDVGAMLLE